MDLFPPRTFLQQIQLFVQLIVARFGLADFLLTHSRLKPAQFRLYKIGASNAATIRIKAMRRATIVSC